VVQLSVPLEVDIGIADNLADAQTRRWLGRA